MKNQKFLHKALFLKNQKELVYTAMSKHLFYFRQHISKFVLENDKIPINPFMIFDYFLLDTIDRDVIRNANNSLLSKSDQIWVFGPIANGVLSEILIGKKENIKINYFKIEKSSNIVPVDLKDVEFEEDVKSFKFSMDY